MTSPLTSMLDQYLKGLPNEANLKEIILGLFAISSSKETLEALYAMKGTEKEFHDRVEQFFLAEIGSLSEEQRQKLVQTLTANNSRVMQQILATFMSQLPEDQKSIVEQNIKEMNAHVNLEPSPMKVTDRLTLRSIN